MEILDARNWTRPSSSGSGQARAAVAEMIAQIRERGDEAIAEYSKRFDGFEPEIVPIPPFEECPISDELKRALKIAAARIEGFAQLQMSMFKDVQSRDQFGAYGSRVLPLERMAAYIPGGRFPLVSTALMTLIPARVAGVPQRVALSPGQHPGVLAAASLAGATHFVRLGGAQAIAAAALGCRWMEPAHMIVGPGNAYVNEAKALLQGQVKIDCLAGPSEILVLCDGQATPEWVALDVLAQAEHDPMALSVLASTDASMLAAVSVAIEAQAARFPEKDKGIIQLVRCQDNEEMIAFSNRMAPEHLSVDCAPGSLNLAALTNYGSLFIGAYSPVALGDYCTGPNHTLPTMGVALQKGGLSVADFLKIVTWQEVGSEEYATLAETAICLAEVEELTYHRLSLEARLDR